MYAFMYATQPACFDLTHLRQVGKTVEFSRGLQNCMGLLSLDKGQANNTIPDEQVAKK